MNNSANPTSLPLNHEWARTPEVAALLDTVKKHLDESAPKKALEFLRKAKNSSPWLRNAMGVCHLRLGDAAAALDALRGLVLASGGLLRQDIPTVIKVNFAQALLATNNMLGFHSAVTEIKDDPHPAVAKLLEAIRAWKKSLSLWGKIHLFLGGEPRQPLVLNFPPGDLE